MISGLDTKNIYSIPNIFKEENITSIISKKLNIEIPKNEKWKELIENFNSLQNEITIAICGKYTSLSDSYASILESLKHCSANLKTKINIRNNKLGENWGLGRRESYEEEENEIEIYFVQGKK